MFLHNEPVSSDHIKHDYKVRCSVNMTHNRGTYLKAFVNMYVGMLTSEGESLAILRPAELIGVSIKPHHRNQNDLGYQNPSGDFAQLNSAYQQRQT